MKHGDLNKYVQYNKRVANIQFDEVEKTFAVHTIDSDDMTASFKEETFDYVIVATGHFWAPHFPAFPGIDQFPGRVLHAHDYRWAKEFKGQRVLVIGGSYSADDIAIQCMKFGGLSVAVSCRRPTGLKWPKGITEYPILTQIKGTTVYFQDGQHIEVDAIIPCTGYLHCFPFVHPELKMKPENLYYPTQLYKGVVFVGGGSNQMMYLGMQNQAFSLPMFDAQAFWSLQYICNNIAIPSQSDMVNDIKKWTQR